MQVTNEELANKVAEITVLRNRMQQMERENLRLENELAQAKEKGTQPSQRSREKVDLERANEQLQYLRQDLLSSDDERKRLKLTLQSQEQELLVLRQRAEEARPATPAATPAAAPVAVPVAAVETRPAPAPAAPPAAVVQPATVARSEPQDEAKGRLLLQELARWETLAEEPRDAWYQLKAAVSRFPGAAAAAATATAKVLRGAAPSSRRQAARVVRMWLGLFPGHAREIAAAAPATEGLFDVLGDILQQAMESQADNGEILPFLLAFSEAASKLKVPELVALKSLVAAGRGWRSVLLEEPTPDSLHLPCLRLLDALMASPELFAMAHQAESQENVLLAAADLLVLPSVAEDERDTLEKQKCRVAALKLFSRCCATASLDFVLQLRAEEGMDTVLQSLVLLCHHELLCLLMYGNPWRNEDLEESRKHRLQAVDTSLFLLASLAWQLSPLKDGLETEKWTIEGRVPREAQFGRTQVLLPSIVDMVFENASEEDFQPFLSSISAVRLLLEEPATPASSGSYPAVVT